MAERLRSVRTHGRVRRWSTQLIAVSNLAKTKEKLFIRRDMPNEQCGDTYAHVHCAHMEGIVL